MWPRGMTLVTRLLYCHKPLKYLLNWLKQWRLNFRESVYGQKPTLFCRLTRQTKCRLTGHSTMTLSMPPCSISCQSTPQNQPLIQRHFPRRFKPMTRLLFEHNSTSFNPLVASSNLARPTSYTQALREILGLFLLGLVNVLVTAWNNAELIGRFKWG